MSASRDRCTRRCCSRTRRSGTLRRTGSDPPRRTPGTTRRCGHPLRSAARAPRTRPARTRQAKCRLQPRILPRTCAWRTDRRSFRPRTNRRPTRLSGGPLRTPTPVGSGTRHRHRKAATRPRRTRWTGRAPRRSDLRPRRATGRVVDQRCPGFDRGTHATRRGTRGNYACDQAREVRDGGALNGHPAYRTSWGVPSTMGQPGARLQGSPAKK